MYMLLGLVEPKVGPANTHNGIYGVIRLDKAGICKLASL